MEKKGLMTFVSTRMSYTTLNKIIENKSAPDFVIIKGEPLSVYAYGEPGKRICADVDILIAKENVKFIIKILEDEGYCFQNNLSLAKRAITMNYSHQTPEMFKVINGIYSHIDINFDLFWGEYKGKRINIFDFISEKVNMIIYGFDIPTITPLKMLVVLILHHYKDLNSIYKLTQNGIKKSMFDDVFYLVKNNLSSITVDNIVEICHLYGIEEYAYYVFYFTNCIYCDDTFNELIDALYSEKASELLYYYGLTEKEKKKWMSEFEDRIDADIYELVKKDLTNSDIKKIEINKKIFGVENI